ncbi:hypothetical protein LP420_09335 [Massilia sp. B-10]|nr:hypothetical protein LP420_09335 [Massilia sp. B-10]
MEYSRNPFTIENHETIAACTAAGIDAGLRQRRCCHDLPEPQGFGAAPGVLRQHRHSRENSSERPHA